jgi:hypothetical protein
MSIFKGTFNKSIKDQLDVRQKAINDRTPQNLSYMNSRNAWIRLSSSVNTFTGGITDKTTLEELNDDGKYDNKLAKQYVLQGGILNDNKLRAGLGDFSNAYSNKASDGTAYRLGIRPMPGITNIDVKSKGAYGSLREATINFQCWDIKQLEELELLYMRPGYSVLLEWGWTPFLDNSNKYNTRVEYTDIIDTAHNKEELFRLQYAKSADGNYVNEKGEKQTTKGYQGNYDAMYGTIKNYGWTARMDGGYDCHTSIISMGEIMESLKINYSPLDNKTQISTKGLITKNVVSDPPAAISTTLMPYLSEAYNQNILAGLFYELWEIGQQLGGTTGFTQFSDKTGNSYSLTDTSKTTGNKYELFRLSLNIKGGASEADNRGNIGKTDEQIYITLESLVNVLNNYVLLQDTDKKTPISSLSVLESDITNVGVTPDNVTGEGYLLALAHPLQISVDPTVCLIKNQLWADGIDIKLLTPGAVDPNIGDVVIKYGKQLNNDYDAAWWKELAKRINAADTNANSDSIQKLIDYVQESVGTGPSSTEELKEIQRRFIEIKANPKIEPGNYVVSTLAAGIIPFTITLAEYDSFYDLLDEGLNSAVDIGRAIGSRDKQGKKVVGSDFAIEAASKDPKVVTDNQLAAKSKQLQNQKDKGSAGTKILQHLKLPYFTNNKWQDELGIIGNIYVNLNMLYNLIVSKDLAAQDPKEKNDVALYDFIKNILKKISSATGDVNNLELFIDPVDGIARIIDINYADRKDNPNSKYENIVEIQVQNLNSVVRSYKIESQIFPDQTATIAIGSQVKGGALGQDNNTLVDFNRGIIDRIVPRKDTPTSPPTTDTPQSNLTTLLESLGVIFTFFTDLDPEAHKTGLLNDGDYDVDEAGKYQNSLKDLINFFKAISTSRTKNKAIIPTKVSLVMDGIGGIVIGNLFRLPSDVLPKGYRGRENEGGNKIGYAVTGLGHSIQNNDWITNVDAQFMILDDPKKGIDGIDIDFGNITIVTTGQEASLSPSNPGISTPTGGTTKIINGVARKNGDIEDLLVPMRSDLYIRHWSSVCQSDKKRIRLQAAAMQNLEKMLTDAYTAGIYIKVNSSYRTYEDQVRIKNLAAGIPAAEPGNSNHGFGLAVDLANSDGGRINPISTPKEWKWIQDNKAKYGFENINTTTESHHYNYIK